jgi:hypothetical protein
LEKLWWGIVAKQQNRHFEPKVYRKLTKIFTNFRSYMHCYYVIHTGEILDRIAKSEPRLNVVYQANTGHGAAVIHAYREALKLGATYVFQTDSDEQFKPMIFGSFGSVAMFLPRIFSDHPSSSSPGRALAMPERSNRNGIQF